MPKANGENGDAVSRQEFNEVVKALTGLAEGMRTLNTTLGSVKEQQTESMKFVKGQTDSAKEAEAARLAAADKAKNKPKTGDDLDGMSGSELAQYMLEQMKGVVSPISDRITADSNTGEAGKAREALEAAVEKHPDFIEFKDEIRRELEANNYLTPEQAYREAKHNNPEKVAAVEAASKEAGDKHAKEEAVVKKEENDEKLKVAAAAETERLFGNAAGSFGGLHPGTGSTESEEKVAMSPQEAGEDAWNKVFGASGVAD